MKEDLEYNVRFVKSVERQRCIYDFTLADYSNKEKQEEAWMNISKEMGSPVGDCKERWRNLRGGLTRHLKLESKKNIRRRKPYYLTEYMQFIVPFTKTRSRAVLPLIQNNLDPDDVFVSDKVEEEEEEEDEGLELMQPPAIVPAGKRSGSPDGESSESFFKFKRPREDSDSDPDMNFFISLLPDVRCMDSSQKRQMKMGVLKLIDDILT
ncbi:uncharacterized protein LOC112126866 [Cimex lectularius]|uniref:Transcription factor Adf-1 n=1 Tax=Cimex lectularius TaxID=79782 RepID=A0A8I6TJS5_CIMLE|nr:uncharacterized protein LOC112126866 [Cimex lectularius]